MGEELRLRIQFQNSTEGDVTIVDHPADQPEAVSILKPDFIKEVFVPDRLRLSLMILETGDIQIHAHPDAVDIHAGNKGSQLKDDDSP